MRSIFVENYKNVSDEEIVEQIRGGNYELVPVIFGRYEKQVRYYTAAKATARTPHKRQALRFTPQ